MKKKYEIGISLDKTYVYARAFRQPYTLELALTVAQELRPLGERYAVHGCLIDLRGTRSVTSVFEKYEFARKKTEVLGIPRHLKTALLKDADDDSPDFMVTVMRNAGYIFEMFIDERKAIDWLKRTESS